MSVDVMSSMRDVDPFPKLWKRATLDTPHGIVCDLLGVPDLVQAKKTKFDKDWPMIRRLVEAHYFEFSANPTTKRVHFRRRQLRVPSLLIECDARWLEDCHQKVAPRPLLEHALANDQSALESAVSNEEQANALATRSIGTRPKKELEAMRRAR